MAWWLAVDTRHKLFTFFSPCHSGNGGTSRGSVMHGRAGGPVWCDGGQVRKAPSLTAKCLKFPFCCHLASVFVQRPTLSCVPLCDLDYRCRPLPSDSLGYLEYLVLGELTQGEEGQTGKLKLPNMYFAASSSSEAGCG